MKHTVAAGLLMYRLGQRDMEFFLVHPGGPYYKNKHIGFWSIPKGLPEGDEDLLETARREFFEETGIRPSPPYHPLGTIRQKAGKVVHAWAFSGEWDPLSGIKCNDFSLEWPPRSGKMMSFPEVDKAAWMNYEYALEMIIAEQRPFLQRLADVLK
ncbi:MAG TPA: NUDIX domain-containing protein [Chryseosolibacter sp.]|nr:NUDIX domain-containing protein [Chryseosolibacter sp.]